MGRLFYLVMIGKTTYADYGHFFYVVFEALRLLAGIFLGHVVDGRRNGSDDLGIYLCRI